MTTQEAETLIAEYIDVRDQYKKTPTPELQAKLKAKQNQCIHKFKYLVTMKTSWYKNFHNYDDLNQEGLDALFMAMNSYKPGKGNIFWWLHKYLDTRISRCANLHTTIRFPLKYTRKHVPHRENVFPVLVDKNANPYADLEHNDMLNDVVKNIAKLNPNQQKVIKMLIGVNGERPETINGVCEKLGMSRSTCNKIINQAVSILKKE